MKRLVVVLTLFILIIPAVAQAEFKSTVSYHWWDANPLALGMGYVVNDRVELQLDLTSNTAIDGPARTDEERWYFVYSRNEDVSLRLGGIYSRTSELIDDNDVWKRLSSEGSLQPLIGVALRRPISDRVQIRLQADAYRGFQSGELESRVIAQVFASGLIIGYTQDSEESFSGPHLAYQFHVF